MPRANLDVANIDRAKPVVDLDPKDTLTRLIAQETTELK